MLLIALILHISSYTSPPKIFTIRPIWFACLPNSYMHAWLYLSTFLSDNFEFCLLLKPSIVAPCSAPISFQKMTPVWAHFSALQPLRRLHCQRNPHFSTCAFYNAQRLYNAQSFWLLITGTIVTVSTSVGNITVEIAPRVTNSSVSITTWREGVFNLSG